MGAFDIYQDVLVPIKQKLESDARIGGRGVKVFYDRSQDRVVEPSIMPAINYFLEAPWSDNSIGVGAYSIRNRKFSVRVGIALWMHNNGDPDQLDADLHSVGADLLDIMRENDYWDSSKQIVLGSDLTIDFDHARSADGVFVGTQKISVLFEMWSK